MVTSAYSAGRWGSKGSGTIRLRRTVPIASYMICCHFDHVVDEVAVG